MANTPLPIIGAGSGGVTITSSQTVELTAPGNRHYQRIVNSGPGVLWCTRDPLATAAVQGPGCFAIQPGTAEEYPLAGSPYVPPIATFATSDSVCNVAVEVA